MIFVDLSQDSDDDDSEKRASSSGPSFFSLKSTSSSASHPPDVKIEANEESGDIDLAGRCKACESLCVKDPSLQREIASAKRTFLSDLNNMFLRCLSWMRRHTISIECGDRTVTLLTCFPFLSSSFPFSSTGMQPGYSIYVSYLEILITLCL